MPRSEDTSSHRARLPLIVWAAAALMLTASAAAVGLWCLKRMHDHVARVIATRTVLDQGEQVADYLADISPPCTTNLSADQWRLFNRMVDGLHAAQRDLQFVSVSRGGVTIIHHQAGQFPLNGAAAASNDTLETLPVRAFVSKQLIELGGTALPVMVFQRDILLPGEKTPVQLQVGFRRSAVDKEQAASAKLIASLFRLSVMTIALAFGACLLLLVWVVRRDRDWAERRRQEEHLAFSGMLANGIVHDFRNPMSAVRLDVQMLERETQRPDGPRLERISELAGRVRRTMERMDKVFQEFLYLARPADEAREPTDLAECVQECLETLAARFEQAAVTPVTRFPTGLPRVLASPFALRRALLNVLLNAVQFSSPQGRVEVLARLAANRVELDVCDRGPGIPPATRRRVFEMFVTTRPGGTGLGLFLARTAIRKCGGEIAALERPGGGTIIRITLRQAAQGSGSSVQGSGEIQSRTRNKEPKPLPLNPEP